MVKASPDAIVAHHELVTVLENVHGGREDEEEGGEGILDVGLSRDGAPMTIWAR